MKTCRKCNTTLIVGENISSSMFKNYDFECNGCKKIKENNYYATPKGKSIKKKATKKWLVKGDNLINNHQNSKKWRNNNPSKQKKLSIKWQFKEGCGVYGIFENGVCLYVGESTALTRRISIHNSLIKNPESSGYKRKHLYYNLQQHTNYVIGILEQTDNHKEREQFYINKLKPMYNGE